MIHVVKGITPRQKELNTNYMNTNDMIDLGVILLTEEERGTHDTEDIRDRFDEWWEDNGKESFIEYLKGS